MVPKRLIFLNFLRLDDKDAGRFAALLWARVQYGEVNSNASFALFAQFFHLILAIITKLLSYSVAVRSDLLSLIHALDGRADYNRDEFAEVCLLGVPRILGYLLFLLLQLLFEGLHHALARLIAVLVIFDEPSEFASDIKLTFCRPVILTLINLCQVKDEQCIGVA